MWEFEIVHVNTNCVLTAQIYYFSGVLNPSLTVINIILHQVIQPRVPKEKINAPNDVIFA